MTAWGERYEIFPEIEPLIEGVGADAHTHVTVLERFTPLSEGAVEIVLRDAAGAEAVFRSDRARRPGIFGIAITPNSAGEFDLLFRVDSAAGREEIAGGRVRVGSPEDPGGLVSPPAPTARAEVAAAAAGGDEVPFLKEQQWKTAFATAWTEEGELAATRIAPARLVARPGGDRILTAPTDGVVQVSPFPFTGLELVAGRPLLGLTPRLDPEQSLAALEGELASAEAELALANTEATRARELAKAGVVSAADRDRAEAGLAVAAARAESARRDIGTARIARGEGGSSAEAVVVRAPFDGAVAEVLVTAGQAVAAGDRLARFVAAGAPWVEAWFAPEAISGLASGPTRITVSSVGALPEPVGTDLPAEVVAVSPTLDEESGRRTLLLKLSTAVPGLAIGQSIEVEIETGSALRGVVIPASAVIEDAGAQIVYVQVSGETMLRREVRVLARAGALRLVSGLGTGERIVVVGGAAIRRSSQISSDVGEGHVH